MKFSYSLIKKFLPKCPAKAELVEGLNLHSFEAENLPGDLFEASLPPNRYSDAASHIGIAREVGVIFGQRLKSPLKRIVNAPSRQGFLGVEVRDKKLCVRYAARYFEINSAGNGKIGQSPEWLKKILFTCGLKPINEIVDLMNYVMLETGQPLHAFDCDKVADSRGLYVDRRKKVGTRKAALQIRRARKNERISTLDNQTFTLDPDVLVVADVKRPLAIAGIKGGAFAGVGENTKRIIVEAANFDSNSIYKTGRKLNLITDAELRFSHGISPALVDFGLDRVTELLIESGAKLLDSIDIYSKKAGDEVIEFDSAVYEKIMGAPVQKEKVQKYFELLGFNLERAVSSKNNQTLLVRIPAWRADIERIEDLIEEVGRIEGYGKLRPVSPVVSLFPAREEDAIILKDRVRSSLHNFQLDEAYNSTFIGDADLRRWNGTARSSLGLFEYFERNEFSTAEVKNAIAADKKFLRPSLLPLLLRNVEENSRFFDSARIFEIGKVFAWPSRGGAVAEKLSLGAVLAAKEKPRLILEMKGLVDEILKNLGVDDFEIITKEDGFRIEVDHKVLGAAGLWHLDKNWTAAAAELDLDKTMPLTEEGKEFIPLKRFPPIMRDISILVGQDSRIGEILETIQGASPSLIENVDLIDEYIGGKLKDKQSLTFRIIFQAEDRTLTSDEVNREMGRVEVALKKGFKAEIR